MRILCHAQHLSGVGHFVRMHTIACGLAGTHEVHLVDGGRPVPHAPERSAPARLRLPRLTRTDGALAAVGSRLRVEALLEARATRLAHAVERIRPDVVLVDHYPFSKWELEREIAAAVGAAREANAGVRVLCSLRDVVRRTRFEDVAEARFEERVLALLGRYFDGILVHADPAFTRLEEHFGRAADLPVPVAYTGFVGAPLGPFDRPPLDEPYAVLSCGGGTRSLPYLLATIEAFRRLAPAGMTLVVFPGAFPSPRERAALRMATRSGPFRLERFTPDFERWLRGSSVSISRAGYNTTVQLLATGVPAVVVPDAGMSDQGPRARRLAELELATVVDGDPPALDAVAAAIERALGAPRPRHGFDLDGVAGTQALLSQGELGWRSTPTSASPSTPA